MRGIDTQVRKIRRRIFKEVANLAYTSDDLINDVEALPYKIVDYDESQYGNIYRERAIERAHPACYGAFAAAGKRSGSCDPGAG